MADIGIAATAVQAIHPVHAWGLELIRYVQGLDIPGRTGLAEAFTFFGDATLYILILPVLFWCVDEKKGFRLALTVFVSNGINIALKETLRVQRPFYYDTSVKLSEQSGFSTPSGHSQNSAVFYPLLASLFLKKHILVAGGIALSFCIGLSRIYLGMHYPTDVLLGWALGALIAATGFFALPLAVRAASKAESGPLSGIIGSYRRHSAENPKSARTWKLAAAALVSLALSAFSAGDSSMSGLVFGFSAGYILLTEKKPGTQEHTFPFRASEGTLVKKLLRALVGFAGLGALYAGLKAVFPGDESAHYTLFRFLRYGLTGFWASGAAPVLFLKMKL